MATRLAAALLALVVVASAQYRVDPRNTYHRVICVVPFIGKGTADDPRRPQYAPLPAATAKSIADPIIAFTQEPTDDGQFAIVEFVARDRKALLPILNDPNVKSLEKGVVSKDAIEAELRKVRKDFDLTQFEVVMP
jgi:hypothetical protein